MVRLTAAVFFVTIALAGKLDAQGPPATSPSNVAQPGPPSVPDHAPVWGGSVGVNASTSGGTQRQNTASALVTAFYEAGRAPTALHWHTRFRADVAYGTAQKPQQERITTTEMLYAEFRQSFDARQLLSALRSSIAPRDADAGTRLWIYGIAAGYHHIAFGLRSEQAYGAGVAHDLALVPGLAVAVDLRHISEHFDGQEPFSSWAVRLHQSYSHTWSVGSGASARAFVLAESVEVVPAFESWDALQARTLVTLALPIVSRLSAPITFGSDYMRNAPRAFKPLYWKTTVGLTYTFGVQ